MKCWDVYVPLSWCNFSVPAPSVSLAASFAEGRLFVSFGLQISSNDLRFEVLKFCIGIAQRSATKSTPRPDHPTSPPSLLAPCPLPQSAEPRAVSAIQPTHQQTDRRTTDGIRALNLLDQH